MNKLDVENIAIFAHHLKELRDKITTAKAAADAVIHYYCVGSNDILSVTPEK